MSKPVKIYRGALGLNTVADPVRIPFDSKTSMTALSKAVNVTIDDTGRVSRRQGFSSLFSASCHSLFCDGGDCLFVEGATMYRLLPDLTRQEVRNGLVIGNRLDYAQVNDDIYYTSPSSIGIVRKGGVHEDWTSIPYVGQDTNRVFYGPMPGSHIAFAFGRMFISVDQLLIYSEPFGLSYFDISRAIPFASRIRMMKPVAGGIFISDEKKTYFLAGNDVNNSQLVEVSDVPALEWSVATDFVNGLDIGMQEAGQCALWVSSGGACLGSPNGALYHLTRDILNYPEGQKGAGLLHNYNFLQTIF